LGSGTILREAIKAADILNKAFNVGADIWSVTSFNQLQRDIRATHRENRLRPEKAEKESYVKQCLKNRVGPVIAATDYIQLLADQIRVDISNPYYVLGTDGFGRSDSREALRDFFEVDAKMIAYTALKALCDRGEWGQEALLKARETLKIDAERPNPITR